MPVPPVTRILIAASCNRVRSCFRCRNPRSGFNGPQICEIDPTPLDWRHADDGDGNGHGGRGGDGGFSHRSGPGSGPGGRSHPHPGRPARPRTIQGHDQGADAVRRSPAGHRAQPQGRRLDRGAAQELRLPDRARQVRLQSDAAAGGAARGGGSRRRPDTARARSSPAAKCGRAGRLALSRHHAPHRRQHRSRRAARREAARAQSRADHAGPARGGLLHQGRHHASRRDVHRRRPHGRARLGRGGQRQRLGHRAGDGAGAHLQHAGRADRAHDPLRAVEQRGDRAQRRARLRRAARRRCRARRIRPARDDIRSRSGSA